MLHYFEGTVFNAPVKTIVNTVNCMGFMGAGIALEFKLRYPLMFEDYKLKCEKQKVEVGRSYIFEVSDQVWIMNFPTKAHWKYPSKIKWIEDGLKYFTDNYKKRDIKSIAFPKLGCSNGGLKWEEVKPIMEKYLLNIELEVYICLDENKEAEGMEKAMLDLLNNSKINELIGNVGINRKQAEAIASKQPIKRFRYIEKMDGVGDKTYARLFEYYYLQSANGTKKELIKIQSTEKPGYSQIDIFGNMISLESSLEVNKKKGRKRKNKLV